MLKNIPTILTPDLLKILMEMGHGDEIVIGDGNFAAASRAQRLIRLDGNTTIAVLDAIMQFFPLDQFDKPSAMLMDVAPEQKGTLVPRRWNDFSEILRKHDDSFTECVMLDRFDFYERAKKAYAIISTGDTEIYACIIIKKGVIM